MFSFEIFQFLEGFLEKIVSRKSRSIHSHFKISQNVERLESGHFSRAWNYLNVFFVLGIVSMFHKLVTNQNSIIYLSRSTFTFFNYLSLYGMNLMLMILDPVSRAQQFRERLSEKNVHATIPTGVINQYTVSYFCCFPLALANICPWPLVPFFQISL